jgi:hypothetical protein
MRTFLFSYFSMRNLIKKDIGAGFDGMGFWPDTLLVGFGWKDGTCDFSWLDA